VLRRFNRAPIIANPGTPPETFDLAFPPGQV
jgi:hypothetical protein